jgi:hypothetical protein
MLVIGWSERGAEKDEGEEEEAGVSCGVVVCMTGPMPVWPHGWRKR